MFTVCPKCSLKLVVTAADLRVAQGYVRCGRCSNVFNALIGLSDEQQAVLARESAAIESAGAQPPAPAPRTSGREHGAERATDSAEAAPDASLEFDPSQTDVSEVFIEPELDSSVGTGSFESIVLRTDDEPVPPPPPTTQASPPREAGRTDPSRTAGSTQAGFPGDRAPGKLLAEAGTRGAQAEARGIGGDRRGPPSQGPSAEHTSREAPVRGERPVAEPRATPERASPDESKAHPSANTARAAAPTPRRVATPQATPRPAPTASPKATVSPRATASPKATATPKATPTPTPTATPKATPTAHATSSAMPASNKRAVPSAAAPATAQGAANAPAAAEVHEFEFDPGEPEAPAGAVVPRAPGSNSQRAAIVREAARRFIQTQRARRAAPAEQAPTEPPIAPPSEANSRSGAEIVDSLGVAVTPEADALATPAWLNRMLRAAVVTLGLLLLAQIVHHYRAQLANVNWLRPPLSAVYAALGMPLAPQWDVSAYEVHQLGAVAGGKQPGALTVRASIKNVASQAQPLPLLRVTVQDRFGNRVAARDVPPRAYLPAASAAPRELAAGERVDAEVELADPGPSAVGFEVDACLADANGRVSCANDSSAAAASSER